jgi:hypothetical protein
VLPVIAPYVNESIMDISDSPLAFLRVVYVKKYMANPGLQPWNKNFGD